MSEQSRAEVLSASRGGHAVVVSPAVAATFAVKRPPVIAYVNGVEYRSRLMVYDGISYLGFRKDLLAAISATVGDEVEVDLALDPERARPVE